MSERPNIDTRLRAAVLSVEAPPFLEARIRNRIRGEKLPRRWLPGVVSATATAAALGGFLIAWQLGHLRFTVAAQEAYISSVSSHVATLMRIGLGDHIHCSVFRKYPTTAPTTEEFVEKMNPQYAGLIPIVRSHVPDTYRMTLAHECRYHGRKFVHLSLRDDSNMLSLVIARKAEGESFRTEDMLPALVQSGIPMYQTGIQRFQMTAFETRDYLVYFISDFSKEKNTDMMLALAPQVKEFLGRLEL
ncbi:MAG TPA: hypothetical protein VKB79_01930 [Bryobacteraceae bacterium]|nr:hypothetical protein [Bryobacteraceae bacterium]